MTALQTARPPTSRLRKISSRTCSPTSRAPNAKASTPSPRIREGLEAFIRSYLSPQHRDQCADGCPSAALLDEIARRPVATKQVFTDELMGVIDDIASRLGPTDAEAARTDALTLFGLMLGTLQLARALTDRDLSDRLLARGVETAMKLLNDRA